MNRFHIKAWSSENSDFIRNSNTVNNKKNMSRFVTFSIENLIYIYKGFNHVKHYHTKKQTQKLLMYATGW